MHDTFIPHRHQRRGHREGPWQGRGPWAEPNDPERASLRRSAASLVGAIRQLRTLTPEQRSEAKAILDDARRKLYQLLAGDAEPTGSADGPDSVV